MNRFINLQFKILAVFALLFVSHAHAQKKNWQNTFIEATVFGGMVWAHHEAINYLVTNHLVGASIMIGKVADGSKPWHKSLGYPTYGLGYQYSSLGSSILGYGHAVYPYIQLKLINQSKYIWQFTLGAGIGYVTNPYNPETNIQNIVNGSHWNAFLKVNSQMLYRISSRYSVSLEGGLFHYSNGNTNEPNWGHNSLYVGGGCKYNLFEEAEKVELSATNNKKIRLAMYFSAWKRDETPKSDVRYFVSDIHTTLWKYYSASSAVGLSISAFYDKSTKKNLWKGYREEIVSLNDFKYNDADDWSYGIGLAYGLNMSPVFFSVEVGVYVKKALNREFYNRWLLEMEIYKKLKVFTGLKSYLGQAEFVEFGLVYDLFKKSF